MRLPKRIILLLSCGTIGALLCTSVQADVIQGLTLIWTAVDSSHAVLISAPQREVISVPEPASVAIWIIAVGLGGFAGWRMRGKDATH